MGSRARIATVCQSQRFFPTVEENREHVMGQGKLCLGMQRNDHRAAAPITFATASIASFMSFSFRVG